MWAYFNLPESDYLAYQASQDKNQVKIKLVLANGSVFPEDGKIGAIEADFNNENGNIAFRGDFPNPGRVLRHGQTGTVLVSRTVKDAVVIPQRAKFEILAKNYVYVVVPEESSDVVPAAKADVHGEGSVEPAATTADAHEPKDTHSTDKKQNEGHHKERGVVRQREINILGELDDIYLIRDGVTTNERIVLEGVQQVRDGDIVEYDYVTPEDALKQLKYHAE